MLEASLGTTLSEDPDDDCFSAGGAGSGALACANPAGQAVLPERAAIVVEPAAPVAQEEAGASHLRSVAWGLRFADPATEASYSAWHQGSAVPSVRVASIAGLFGVALAWLSVGLEAPQVFRAASVFVLGILYPLFAMGLYVCARPHLVKWVVPVGALGNAATGLVAVGFDFWAMHRPDVSYGWVMVAAFYGFAVVGLRPVQASAAALSYVAFYQLLLIRAFVQGQVGVSNLVWYSSTPWTVFATGLLASALLDRNSRSAYRRERIIEQQRTELERERALSERLQVEARAQEVKVLNEELRRQVAERARDLAEALLRLPDVPRTPARFAAGDVIEGRYRVIRVLGEGGMGQVHEVERLADQRRLALKVMTRAAHRGSLVRFAREAQIAAQLDHPNVVAALDVGVTRTGTLFLVMQLVQGTTLADQRTRYGDSAWAIPILAQIAEGLAAMHSRRIVHRDLKPSNILLEGNTARVADFGIARLADDESAEANGEGLTRTGAVVGTPMYMAPELARGIQEATPAADIFSLGVVSYLALARRLPHSTPPVRELLEGRVPSKPLPLRQLAPNLSIEVETLVHSCLAHEPERRPTAETIAQELGKLLGPRALQVHG